jgi:hypothetical protein
VIFGQYFAWSCQHESPGSDKESNCLLAPAGGNGRGTSFLLLSVASIKRSTSRELRLKGPLSELQKPVGQEMIPL